MAVDTARLRTHLHSFDFCSLFIEELGWDHCSQTVTVDLDGRCYPLEAVAQKRGFVVFNCPPSPAGGVPAYGQRQQIDNAVAKQVHEHLIIFTDAARRTQIWQWVKREPGKTAKWRHHVFRATQSGESLIQRLNALAIALQDEEELSIVGVANRAQNAFDVERVTKRFYDLYRGEHQALCDSLRGLPSLDDRRWYASVILNRLMFVYFVQWKRFLNDDPDYLSTKLADSRRREPETFFRRLLCPLFFEGFALRREERAAETKELLGTIPYLNGGLFQKHPIEDRYGATLDVPDTAFERLFAFFKEYQWHLDDRPLRDDREINPDVLGYIFEKYINQKQMGAYYTKEDITEYITRSTVIPRLFDLARDKCRVAFEGEHAVWKVLPGDPDRYIFEALRKGVDLPLPVDIQAGIHDVTARAAWNRSAPAEYALPTETWREVIARRQRCNELRQRLADDEVSSIDDLVTLNLDIRQFARDVIQSCERPDLLRAIWKSLVHLSVLDPTVGSGAFLFAALNILDDLYEACLDRMQAFIEELDSSPDPHRPEKMRDFRDVLGRMAKHPNQRYFILKSIVVNNLFGVDLMEEAVEICKLRLFLKLVAQLDRVEDIEPLPDIDFNIRTGNTLVGYVNLREVEKAVTTSEGGQGRLAFGELEETLTRIKDNADLADRAFKEFQLQQSELGGAVTSTDKAHLRGRLRALADQLDHYLAKQYEVKPEEPIAFEAWRLAHQPFHWFSEFYGIMTAGGFDVIVGNPPYVLLNKVSYGFPRVGLSTLGCGNLYALVVERSLALAGGPSPVGMIVPLTAISSGRLSRLQDLLKSRGTVVATPFPRRPQSVFEGVEMPVVILLSFPCLSNAWRTTRTNRFYAEERSQIISGLVFAEHQVRLAAHRVAKLGSATDLSVARKLLAHRQPLGTLSTSSSKWLLYYQEACRYWVKASATSPPFRRNGVDSQPPHWRTLPMQSADALAFATCVLNSSLFYWFYTVFSDCEHVNDALMRSFPVPEGWTALAWDCRERSLGDALLSSSIPKKIRTSQGHSIEYLELRASRAKTAIDAIDQDLAELYGLDGAELDFIINYDIKYRVGATDESAGGD